MWPMDTYISTTRNTSEVQSRRLSTGVSLSFRASASLSAPSVASGAPLTEAP